MSNGYLQSCLKDIIYKGNKSEIVYKVKISFLYLLCVIVGVSPYIVIAGLPKIKNERKISNVLHEYEASYNFLQDMVFLNGAVDGVVCESK